MSLNALARWRLTYVSSTEDGERTTVERIVQIRKVQPRLRQLTGYCELRQAERTFSLWNIARAVDESTGLDVNLDEWLTAYISARRTRRGTTT